MLLVADTRERAVIQHGFGDEYEVKVEQMTVGDYAVVHENKVLAIIERKTLSDFAASIKDGRMDNREKLKKLREETGCKVYFIIEGRHDRLGVETVISGSIKWRHLESSIFHMQIRDDFHFIYTANIPDTAAVLIRLMTSFTTLHASAARATDMAFVPKSTEQVVVTQDARVAVIDNRTGAVLRMEGDGGATIGDVLNYAVPDHMGAGSVLLSGGSNEITYENKTQDVIARLKEKVVTPDDAVLIDMWKQLPFVGNVTACTLARQFTLAELFAGEVAAHIDTMTINGQRIKIGAAGGIKNITAESKCKVLRAIPRWSINSANAVLAKHNGDMKALIADTELYNVMVSKKKLGASCAASLTKFMHLKL